MTFATRKTRNTKIADRKHIVSPLKPQVEHMEKKIDLGGNGV